jgi:glucosylglycerate phosphorylase
VVDQHIAPADSFVDSAVVARIRQHLEAIYPPGDADRAEAGLLPLLDAYAREHPAPEVRAEPFDETDVVLITYADQIHEPGTAPLQSLRRFIHDHLAGVVTGVHLLPFYPWTSDDGFSVVDYRRVDPEVGSWDDVRDLAGEVRLMVDAVVNHVSSQSPWFTAWRSGTGYENYFITAEPGTDLSTVTRPRPQPVLTEFDTADGPRHVWTTFSPDQVDLNYANPDVLVDVTDVLLGYVRNGAGIIRLDAIAFLWKQVGTSCIHLRETHEVIRLWRTILEAVAPGTLLITETNVPHAENITYFGSGHDEAHLVYQFPLAPLVLAAFHWADTRVLQEWMHSLSTPSDGTAFFNFLGSHDGVGVRPAEGLLTHAEITQLCDLATAHGGGVSYRAAPDGSLGPYELNTVFFDALTEVDSPEPSNRQVDRFLAAQAILLALAGVPGLYVQGVLGSRNWQEGVEQTGRLRTINRQKFARADLEAELADPQSLRARVLTGLRHLITTRTAERAFHPNGPQRILDAPPGLLVLERTAPEATSRVLCLHSVTGRPQRYQAGPDAGVHAPGPLRCLLSGEVVEADADGRLDVALPPYGVRWLRS